MARPLIAIVCNTQLVDARVTMHAVADRNIQALAEVARAMPILVPARPEAVDVPALVAMVDGVMLVGGRANVHPERFGLEPDAKHEPYDPGRDAVALDLAKACVESAVPLLGICRGLQEMNVAFGGTLHPEISELPGRMNHRAPRLASGEMHPDPTIVFSERHDVELTEGGVLATLLGARTIRVNSLHGQGILKLGERIAVEGIAEDGTIEAISVKQARSFALGVQWHAEYEARLSDTNRRLFEAFGAAARSRSTHP